MSDKNVPEVRFEGFVEPWESNEVANICSISTGKSNTQDRANEGKYPFYVRSSVVERSSRYLYDEEAVLTIGDGVGTGKVYHYVNGKYDLHQRVYRMFNFKKEVTGKYFYYYFSKHFYERVMSMTAKTSVDSVRLEMISDMKFVYPSKCEQDLIASLISSLDDTIALKKQQHQQTANIKKAMLEKMFPKKGATVPDVRFDGFVEPWIVSDINDVLSEPISNGITNRHGSNELNIKHINVVNLYSHSFIRLNELEYINVREKELAKCRVKVGDIFLTRSSLKVEGIAHANILLDEYACVFDDHIMRVKFGGDFEPFFMKELLNHSIVKSQFMDKSKTTTMTTIGQSEIASCFNFISLITRAKRNRKFLPQPRHPHHHPTGRTRQAPKHQEVPAFQNVRIGGLNNAIHPARAN